MLCKVTQQKAGSTGNIRWQANSPEREIARELVRSYFLNAGIRQVGLRPGRCDAVHPNPVGRKFQRHGAHEKGLRALVCRVGRVLGRAALSRRR